MLTTNAIDALKQMSANHAESVSFPLTNKAGGSKANRDAVAELKKAEMIKTFTNAVVPEGCVMVKFSKKAKELLSSLGETGHACAGSLSAVDVTYTNTGISTIRNEQGKAVAANFVEEVRVVRVQGSAEIVTTAKLISEKACK